MGLDNDWDGIRPQRQSRVVDAGMGILRITLLFGSAAVALALIAAPILESKTREQFASDRFIGGLDTMSTGSIGQRNVYTVRRSVLQASPSSVCLIRDNGSRSGEC